jgi:hypothetical protein
MLHHSTVRTCSVLTALCLLGTLPAIVAAEIVNGDFSDGLNGWTATISPSGSSGSIIVDDDEQALITEGNSFLVTLQQTFEHADGPELLRFDVIQEPGLDLTADFIPDAFEVTLMHEEGYPAAWAWSDLATSFFNLQEDGTISVGDTTTFEITPAGRMTVSVDLDDQTPPGLVTLYFDYIGADRDGGGGIRIDNVQLFGDCNANGVRDDDDILNGTSNDCDGDGIPDECEQCGDFNNDDAVDEVDFDIFRLAFGRTAGHEAYIDCADYNENGLIDFVDYQCWMECYRDYQNNLQTPSSAPEQSIPHQPLRRPYIDSIPVANKATATQTTKEKRATTYSSGKDNKPLRKQHTGSKIR